MIFRSSLARRLTSDSRHALSRPGLQNSARLWSCRGYTTAHERERAKSLDRYYNDIITHPSQAAPPTPSTSAPPPAPGDPLPKTEKEATIQKARVIFGSRLAGPVERRRELDQASTKIAGILVPPRPDEPDNCCMSGCVNCVWDRYRDELEEWAEKSAQAREALQAQRREERQDRIRTRGSSQAAGAGSNDMPTHVASSMDDDGGGSEALWTGTDDDKLPGVSVGKNEDLFAGVPVGIREFMRNEKILREKKKKKKMQMQMQTTTND